MDQPDLPLGAVLSEDAAPAPPGVAEVATNVALAAEAKAWLLLVRAAAAHASGADGHAELRRIAAEAGPVLAEAPPLPSAVVAAAARGHRAASAAGAKQQDARATILECGDDRGVQRPNGGTDFRRLGSRGGEFGILEHQQLHGAFGCKLAGLTVKQWEHPRSDPDVDQKRRAQEALEKTLAALAAQRRAIAGSSEKVPASSDSVACIDPEKEFTLNHSGPSRETGLAVDMVDCGRICSPLAAPGPGNRPSLRSPVIELQLHELLPAPRAVSRSVPVDAGSGGTSSPAALSVTPRLAPACAGPGRRHTAVLAVGGSAGTVYGAGLAAGARPRWTDLDDDHGAEWSALVAEADGNSDPLSSLGAAE